MNFGFTAFYIRIKTLNRQLSSGRQEFGYTFNFSSWQAYNPEEKRNPARQAQFPFRLGVSVANRKQAFEPFLTGHGERARLKDRGMLGPFAAYCVSISVGTAMICH